MLARKGPRKARTKAPRTRLSDLERCQRQVERLLDLLQRVEVGLDRGYVADMDNLRWDVAHALIAARGDGVR